jgi:hypothetical protein
MGILAITAGQRVSRPAAILSRVAKITRHAYFLSGAAFAAELPGVELPGVVVLAFA